MWCSTGVNLHSSGIWECSTGISPWLFVHSMSPRISVSQTIPVFHGRVVITWEYRLLLQIFFLFKWIVGFAIKLCGKWGNKTSLRTEMKVVIKQQNNGCLPFLSSFKFGFVLSSFSLVSFISVLSVVTVK